MKEIILKKADKDILKELHSVKFDSAYLTQASGKYTGSAYKLFNLKPYEANILKQMCLSLGFDCAVSRDTVTCKCEHTDCIVFASPSQIKKLSAKLENQPFRLKQTATLFKEALNNKLLPLTLKNVVFDWSKPYIAGILNITPDSFSDGGKYNDTDIALKRVETLIEEGADIIDIGGESTRHGALTLAVNEEIERVVPVIKEIRKRNINIPLSVDTRNYETAKTAIGEGCDIINDVSGLEHDNRLFEFVVSNNIPVIIMHSNAVPAVCNDFTDQDIVEEIYFYFYSKIKILTKAGLEKSKIIIDPGIGFGKCGNSNFGILKRINEFTSVNVPILSGISRKSFIRSEFNISVEESDVPTALYSAMLKDVNIHRVHNVKLVKRFLDYAEMLKTD